MMDEEVEEAVREEIAFRPLLPSSLQNRRRIRTEEESGARGRPPNPNTRLRNGSELPPEQSAVFQPKHANILLEDLDPFYDDTFIVVTGRRRLYRFGSSNAFWFLTPFNPLRKSAVILSTHYVFNWIVIFTLVYNCFFFLPSPKSWTAKYFETLFVGIYLLEFVVKLIARGFILDKFAYLRDPWNVLDFVIIIFALFGHITPIKDNLGFLRFYKLIGSVQSWRNAFESVLEILTKLLDVTILTTLMLVAFAILGVHEYHGILLQRCIKTYEPNSGIDWITWNSNPQNWLEYPSICGNKTGAGACAEDYTCIHGFGPNPNYGLTSFDNFWWGMLSSIQMMKLDFWEDLYQSILRVGGPWNKVYFASSMFICSFYMMALIFGSVAHEVAQQVKRKKEEKKADLLAFSRSPLQNFTIYDSIKHSISECFGKVTDLLCVWDCCLPCTKFREWVGFVIFDPFAVVFITVVLIIDTFFLSLIRHSIHENVGMLNVVYFGMMIFIFVYILEMILKLMALGPKPYFEDGWRKLEFWIVFFCVIELAASRTLDSIHTDLMSQTLVRILIIFRLAQYWPTFNKLRKHLGRILSGELLHFFLVIQFIMMSFAVLGTELFARGYYTIHEEEKIFEGPRWNFLDFGHSYMIVFRALCGEWIESMWDCAVKNGNACVPFFLGVVFIGNMFCLTLFVLLYHRVLDGEEEEREEKEVPNKLNEALERVKGWVGWTGSHMGGVAEGRQRLEEAEEDEITLNRTASMEEREEEGDGRVKQARALPPPSAWGKVRRISEYLVENRFFNPAMVAIIVLSSVALTFEDIHMTAESYPALLAIDIIFTLIILTEALLRMGAKGPFEYFKSAWCWLDFIIVGVSLFELILGEAHAGTGSLRGMRLLMVLSRVESTRKVVEIIAQVAKRILTLIPACIALWHVFAAAGTWILSGKFYHCINPEDGMKPWIDVVQDKQECLVKNMSWENSEMNFDHVGNAYLSLFMISTFKGWLGIMNDAVDSRQVDDQHVREVSFELYTYFVLFIIFGVFLNLTWLLGEAVKELNEQKKKRTGNALPFFMNEVELSYEAAQRIRSGAKGNSTIIPTPQGRVQRALLKFCQSKWFEGGMALFMTFFLCVAATVHYKMSIFWEDLYQYVDLIFGLVITLECVLKIMTFRRHYFTEASNIFDLIVVVSGLIQFAMMEFVHFGNILSLAPLLIIKAVKSLLTYLYSMRKGMRTLLQTWGRSLPDVISASLVLLVLICSYSLIGMLQFQEVKHRGALDEIHNFQTFHQSFILMFQITTGAGWDGILNGIGAEDECDGFDCGNKNFAVPFLISFLILCFFVVAFMFLTVILEFFFQKGQEGLGLSQEDFKGFDQVWERFDPDGTNYIKRERLEDFLDQLKPPLQVQRGNQQNLSLIESIPTVQGDSAYSEDVLTALIKNHFQTQSSNS